MFISPLAARQRAFGGFNLAGSRLGALGAGENPFSGAGGATAIGAGASMVKTKNQTTSLAAQGASAGATVGSVFPGIGTVIGAVAGAIIGAIGGAFIGSKRPESELWDNYKKMAGNAGGHEYDNAFRNGAFVGLMRLGKNTFPPRAKGGYGPNDDAKFLRDMTAKIADGFRSGVLGPKDGDANTIFSKVVGPWIAQWGTESSPDWKRWEDQIVKDQIDAWLYDQPTIATSYTTSTWAQPRVGTLASEVLAKYQSPAPSSSAPATSPGSAPSPVLNTPSTAQTPVGPVTTLPVPANSQTPAVVPVPPITSATDPNLQAYIKALMDQGASQQQAFNAALQAMQNSGVAPTPEAQTQVAQAVQSAGAGGSNVFPPWVLYAAAAAAVVFALARPHHSRSH